MLGLEVLLLEGGDFMSTYSLRGIAEGLAGVSSVQADSLEDLFRRFPALAAARAKLRVDGNHISGFAACDG